MGYKNIVIIDDMGDVAKPLSGAFGDDSQIKVRHIASDFDSLRKFLKRDTYMILINETDLKVGLGELVDFIKNNLFS